jgi:tyrosyl-tRNA synthetase
MFGNKIITDNQKIERLLSRNVEEVIDSEHLKERLLKGDKLRVKLGIDPTSPNIHIGRAINLWKLREFQDLGHTAVFIVGDFTGLVGDNSDKETERPMLSENQVSENMKTYFDQAFKILDKGKTETKYNSTWLKKLGFLEISKMADKFGLHEFSARELIKKRLDVGKRVSLREFSYPLMQGYDSVAVKADVELGGRDQRFNLLAGRTIQPIYGQVSQDIVITEFPLEGTDGRKMSSSWGNVINITDEAKDMFGKVMSIQDNLIIKYFKLATHKSLDQVKAIEEELNSGANPRDIKLRLAKEIVSLYHSENEAMMAEEEFKKVFSEGKLPDDLKEINIEEGMTLVSLLAKWLNISNSEAKRLISDQKGVRVDDEVIIDWNYKIKRESIIKVGPRNIVKIK